MAAETTTGDSVAQSIPEQVQIRQEKRQRILANGREAYPVAVPVTAKIIDLRTKFGDLEPGVVTESVVGVAGRVVFLRNTGRLCFVTLQDGSGNRIQAMLSEKAVGKEELANFKADVDLGDILFVTGPVGTSKRGELSVFADEWQIATKALRPLPVLHKDLSEESRVRQRYVDLITRAEARDMVRTRAAVMRSLRDNLHERDFIEIETPMLQTIASGASARPFQTHMNAYDIDLFLRIAPELFLKRAVVGGVERVFEINRNFRNEGADSSHSPEFAMLEIYEAYGDYNSMAELTQSLVQRAAVEALGTTVVQLPEGTVDASGAPQTEYDLGGEWATISMYESLSEALGRQITPATDSAELLSEAIKCGLYDPEVDQGLDRLSHGKLVETLWEHLVGEHLWEPTFVRDFPVETSPLTRSHRNTAGVVEKWDLYIRGFELATAYSELVDPVIQRERLVAQAELAAAGDGEAMQYDEDFLVAMEHGMPPSGGMGMGIDRLLMALTGQGIRETILFPLVKPTGR